MGVVAKGHTRGFEVYNFNADLRLKIEAMEARFRKEVLPLRGGVPNRFAKGQNHHFVTVT